MAWQLGRSFPVRRLPPAAGAGCARHLQQRWRRGGELRSQCALELLPSTKASNRKCYHKKCHQQIPPRDWRPTHVFPKRFHFMTHPKAKGEARLRCVGEFSPRMEPLRENRGRSNPQAKPFYFQQCKKLEIAKRNAINLWVFQFDSQNMKCLFKIEHPNAFVQIFPMLFCCDGITGR